jgi:hypothetical protein
MFLAVLSAVLRISQLKADVYEHHGTLGYSDYDVFLENDEGSRVYRCKKLF